MLNVMSRHLQLMEDQCNSGRQQSANALEEMFPVMKMLDERLRNMNPVAMLDLQKFHARAFQLFQTHRNVFLLDFIRNNMERGIAEGLYRPDLEIDILSRFRTACVMFCVQPDVFPMQTYDMSKVQLVLLEHFLFGLVTKEGYELIETYRKQRP
ncbi:hypothetical protein MKQ70_24230 [Chitinophaga sedimenti]|uniref:hypothetical protein n=1 Tax=Chitinophaga sedimenti TaxID=2033606 RepID=UPI002003AC49|nr:hypothetical protein [Chitinophaga sedimenti]MCK7557947.1 hypothetical protein [Chitinophaga sedimenti]